MNNSSRTQKSDILDSMMKHPETRKLIKDALSSPIGSTSRAKLQKHMSIMGKLHNSNYSSADGAGGPGIVQEQPPEEQPEFDPVHIPSDNSKGMVIFYKIPTPKITYGKKATSMDVARKDQERAGSFDGQGGPGMNYDGAGGFLSDLYDSAKTTGSKFFNPSKTSSYTPVFSSPFTSTSGSSFIPSTTPQTPQTSLNSQNIPLMAQGSYNNTPIAPTITPKSNISPTYVAPVTSTSTYANSSFGPSPSIDKISPNNIAATSSVPVLSKTKQTPAVDPVLKSQIDSVANRSNAEIAGRDLLSKYGQLSAGLLSLGPALAGVGEYAVKNTYKGIANQFLGQDNQYGYTKLGDTWGIKGAKAKFDEADRISNKLTSGPDISSLYKGLNKQLPTQNKVDEKGKIVTTPSEVSTKTTVAVTNPVKTSSGTSEISNNGISGNGSAAKNYSAKLGLSLDTPLSVVAQTKTKEEIIDAITANEGSSPAGVINNRGNIKFNNLDGQIDSGVKASDGGTFASYKTKEEGDNAIYNLFLNAAAGKSPNYGANPTLGSFADKYTNTGSTSTDSIASKTGSPSGSYIGSIDPITGTYTPSTAQPGAIGVDQFGNPLKAGMQGYIDASMGAGAATAAIINDKNNPYTKGMSEQERLVELDKSTRERSGVDADKAEYEKLVRDGTTLPDDMASFIKNRETDLAQTDAELNQYSTMLSSTQDPAAKRDIKMRMNTLYAQRGKLNQNYMQIIDSAVKDHKVKIDNAKAKFDTDLSDYQTQIARDSAITKEKYAEIRATVADMYKDMQDAPVRAMQLREYQQKLYTSAYGTAADASKVGLIAQSKLMEGTFMNEKRVFIPTDETMVEWKDKLINMDVISVPNFVAAWNNSINNYLTEPENAAGTQYTEPQKTKLVEDQVTNYTDLVQDAITHPEEQYSEEIKQAGIQGAIKMAGLVGERKSAALASKGPGLIASIKTLAPTGLLGFGKATPSLPEFTATLNKNLGGDNTDLAKALYFRFTEYVSNVTDPTLQKLAPSYAVDTLLYNVNSTSGADGNTRISKANQRTPEEVAKLVGSMYGDFILYSNWARNADLAPLAKQYIEARSPQMIQ